MPEDAARLSPGFFLGSYRILEYLGTQAGADRYRAKHAGDQRVVLVSVFPRTGPWPDDPARAGEGLARLEHPAVARFYEYGSQGEIRFCAEEFVEGVRGRAQSLADELANHGGRLPEDLVRILGRQIWEGMRFLHRSGISGPVAAPEPERILLTGRKRVKWAEMGVRGAGRGSSGGAEAENVRAYGALLYRMLSGAPWTPAAPGLAASGHAKAWDALIATCLGAPDNGRIPADDEIGDALLNAGTGAGGRTGWRLLRAVAASLVLAACLFGAYRYAAVSRERARAAEEEVRTARVAELEASLMQAETALAEADTERARRLAADILASEPGNRRATALLEDIRVAEGLAGVADIRALAEERWAATRGLDPEQGFAPLIRNVDGAFREARTALEEKRFEDARQRFADAVAAADELLRVNGLRVSATDGRARAAGMRLAAETAEAPRFAPEEWARGEENYAAGESALANAHPEEAAAAYGRAESDFAAAEARGEGRRRVADARSAAMEARSVFEGEDAVRMPKGVRDRVTRLGTEADAAEGAGDWDTAVSRWRDAATVLQDSAALVVRATGSRDYTTAMARGASLLREKRYEEAEKAFAAVLLLPGHEQDREVIRLRLQARGAALQEQIARHPRGRDGNLVPNGAFEEGRGEPDGWTRPDNLTVFWERCGASGKGLRLDTDVYRSEWEAHRSNPGVPMEKTPTSGTRYDTVGGTTGVAVYSSPVPVELGGIYRVSFDVKGPGGEPFVFLKGFRMCGPEDVPAAGTRVFFTPHKEGPAYSLMVMGTSGEEKRRPKPGDFIQIFRRRIVARFPGGEENTWRRYEGVVELQEDRGIEVVLLELYAFWPPGTYFFDNVSMVRISADEATAFRERREAAGKSADYGTPVH